MKNLELSPRLSLICLFPSSVTQVIGGKSSSRENAKEAQSRQQMALDLSRRRVTRPSITMRWSPAFETLRAGVK